ncbi:MAG: phosphoribosyltransferase [Cyanobacteria bacterium RYN_339]|nr:phosphoribosyltransferase [Cyanobacteria bacterium RYN_339]
MFHDREEAGRLLAGALEDYPRLRTCVLALNGGGAPVGRAIADALRVPLEVMVVEPISPPRDPDVAIGWVTARGATWLDRARLRRLYLPPGYLATETELRREAARDHEVALRQDAPRVDLAGKVVILAADGVPDVGMVTAAVEDLRWRGVAPTWIALAAPVVWPEPKRLLPDILDELILLHTPTAIGTVGQDYREYAPVGDAEVRRLLER